jgi:hypothetical protein
MTCGAAWNGGRVVNDQTGVYPWTINGKNFGSNPGSVSIVGRPATIQSWSPTQIVIQPTAAYNSSPLCAVMLITTSTGAKGTFGTNIVPAVRSRVFQQCTWWVAYSRLNMGKQPSATAYGGYTSITAQWIPQVGDQLEWDGEHTAIISSVQGPTLQSAGAQSWTLGITEYNSKCTNQFNSYTTTFTISKGSVGNYPQSSVKSLGGATVFYR